MKTDIFFIKNVKKQAVRRHLHQIPAKLMNSTIPAVQEQSLLILKLYVRIELPETQVLSFK